MDLNVAAACLPKTASVAVTLVVQVTALEAATAVSN